MSLAAVRLEPESKFSQVLEEFRRQGRMVQWDRRGEPAGLPFKTDDRRPTELDPPQRLGGLEPSFDRPRELPAKRVHFISKDEHDVLRADKHIAGLVFAPDGDTLAVASGGKIDLWDVAKRELRTSFEGLSGYITALAYSPNGARFVTLYGPGRRALKPASRLLMAAETRRM